MVDEKVGSLAKLVRPTLITANFPEDVPHIALIPIAFLASWYITAYLRIRLTNVGTNLREDLLADGTVLLVT